MKAIRYLIKPFLKFERVKVLIQILYITTNRIIRYKHIKKKRKQFQTIKSRFSIMKIMTLFLVIMIYHPLIKVILK